MEFSAQHILAVLLLGNLFLAGIWDVCFLSLGRPEATVSKILQGWSLNFPILPLLIGVLLGHLFWP